MLDYVNLSKTSKNMFSGYKCRPTRQSKKEEMSEMSVRQSRICADSVVWDGQLEKVIISIAMVRKTKSVDNWTKVEVYIEKSTGPSKCHGILDSNQSSVTSKTQRSDREGRRI